MYHHCFSLSTAALCESVRVRAPKTQTKNSDEKLRRKTGAGISLSLSLSLCVATAEEELGRSASTDASPHCCRGCHASS